MAQMTQTTPRYTMRFDAPSAGMSSINPMRTMKPRNSPSGPLRRSKVGTGTPSGQTRGPNHQDDEHQDVAEGVRPGGGDVGRAQRLGQSHQQPGQHGALDAAQAADQRHRKGFDDHPRA